MRWKMRREMREIREMRREMREIRERQEKMRPQEHPATRAPRRQQVHVREYIMYRYTIKCKCNAMQQCRGTYLVIR
jgi:hypothetical protein